MVQLLKKVAALSHLLFFHVNSWNVKEDLNYKNFQKEITYQKVMTVRAIMAKRAIANRTVHTQNLKHKIDGSFKSENNNG